MSVIHNVTASFKRYFVSGVLVVVPLILTYIVLKFLFEAVDGILQPVLHRILGYWVTGLGVLTTLLLIILAGVITRNFVGARMYRTGEKILSKVPIIRPIYSSAKQLLEAVAQPSMDSFKAVVLIEYPRRGAFALSFLSNRISLDVGGEVRSFVSVFIPSTPTPISGIVVLVPEDEATILDMTVEEGVKFLVSGGVASPKLIKSRSLATA
ncbi:MAG: DUF502 domain-containing protein [bacterium]